MNFFGGLNGMGYGGCGSNNGCCSIIWLLFLLQICGCSTGCGDNNGCGNDCSCIWIILLLLCCCNNGCNSH